MTIIGHVAARRGVNLADEDALQFPRPVATLTRCQHGVGTDPCPVCPAGEQETTDSWPRLPCPPWCRTDHAAAAADERRTGVRLHERQVPDIAVTVPGGHIAVTVHAVDDLVTGRREPTWVECNVPVELSPLAAHFLATQLVVAVDIAGGWRP